MLDTYFRIAYEYLKSDDGLIERERHYFDIHDAPAPYCPYPPGCVDRNYATSQVIRETGFREYRTVPAPATRALHARRMDDDDEPLPKLGPGWDHLFLRDTRTPEEREAAESKERARRLGGGRRDWWKDKTPAK